MKIKNLNKLEYMLGMMLIVIIIAICITFIIITITRKIYDIAFEAAIILVMSCVGLVIIFQKRKKELKRWEQHTSWITKNVNEYVHNVTWYLKHTKTGEIDEDYLREINCSRSLQENFQVLLEPPRAILKPFIHMAKAVDDVQACLCISHKARNTIVEDKQRILSLAIKEWEFQCEKIHM